MANAELAEYLQFHSQGNEIGCVDVTSNGRTGHIYLHHGQVVHAELENGMGFYAFFTILSWPEAKIAWKAAQMAPRITLTEAVDTLLFQMAQLEDSGQADEVSLKATFDAGQRATVDIKLVELKQFQIMFEVLSAELSDQSFTLQKDVTLVGRAEDCDFIIRHPSISGHHCAIYHEKNYVRVRDLGSTNGTQVNGVLVSESIFQVGDELTLGGIKLRMSMKMQRKLSGGGSVPANTSFLETSLISKSPTQRITISPKKPAASNASPSQEEPKKPAGHQPITWKNIAEEESQKKTGILGKFFKKPQN